MSDTMAAGAAHALRASGLRIPGDVSLIGRNDSPLSRHMDPPLTTIDIQIGEAGRVAADMLLERMRSDQTNAQVSIPGIIVDRESVNEVKAHAG